ncbi:hypothetical protein VSR34_01170 [Paraburkholderia sp. JHI2823]|uniref:hypothetical protein n=1 Tax=Paraburkholderia sp. JHI2823 TaxID=3112960 RepID=UPI003177874E
MSGQSLQLLSIKYGSTVVVPQREAGHIVGFRCLANEDHDVAIPRPLQYFGDLLRSFARFLDKRDMNLAVTVRVVPLGDGIDAGSQDNGRVNGSARDLSVQDDAVGASLHEPASRLHFSPWFFKSFSGRVVTVYVNPNSIG